MITKKQETNMSVNSLSNSSDFPSPDVCHGKSLSIFTALFISYILLLPLFFLVLYVGFKRWRKQRSVATAAMMSHSDIFTFNVVFLELMGVLSSCLYFYAIHTKQPILLIWASYVSDIISPVKNVFHLLTCVDRYLAVVHPVTYLKLRQRGGVRIRNVSIVCAWLLCFGTVILLEFDSSVNMIFFISLSAFCVVGVFFFSISVLCVLIRPGPGEVGGNTERVDQSKLRAFYTMMAITGALFLRFLSTLLVNVSFFSSQFSSSELCLIIWSAAWFSLPSILVLPLLFLQRAGKLPGCKHKTESG